MQVFEDMSPAFGEGVFVIKMEFAVVVTVCAAAISHRDQTLFFVLGQIDKNILIMAVRLTRPDPFSLVEGVAKHFRRLGPRGLDVTSCNARRAVTSMALVCSLWIFDRLAT